MSPPMTTASGGSRAQLGDHGVERRQVAVDVVQRGDAPHQAVTGRAWRTNSAPSSIAHSMSCGIPSRSSRSRPTAASSASCSSSSVRAAPRSGAQRLLARAAGVVADDRVRLRGERLALDPPVARQDVLVRRHLAGDDRLAEPEHRLDHHAVAAAARRVDREQHAGDVRLDHPLHDDRHVEVVERALARAVEQRALGEERRPAVAHAADHLGRAADVQVGLLLAGEARGLRVLRARARPDRDGRVVAQLARRRRRSRRAARAAARAPVTIACARSAAAASASSACAPASSARSSAPPSGSAGDQRAGRHGEAGRDREPEPGHARQRRALAAGGRDVQAALVVEAHHRRSGVLRPVIGGSGAGRRRARRRRPRRPGPAARAARSHRAKPRRGRAPRPSGAARRCRDVVRARVRPGGGERRVARGADRQPADLGVLVRDPGRATRLAGRGPRAAAAVAEAPPSSPARQSANSRINRPETSCITPRPNRAAGPLIARSVSTRTRVAPSAGSSRVVIVAAAPPAPPASRPSARSTARREARSASSIRIVPW